MQSDIEQKKLVLNDLLVNYYHIPGKNTVPLVFLHGWGCDATIWAPLLKDLTSHGYEIYALDMPGFGGSQTPSIAYTISDYATIVDVFTKKLSLKKIHIIGHSFGGRIGIKLAALKPTYLKSLTLVDAAGLPHQNKATSLKKALATIVKPIFAFPFMQPLRKQLYYAIGAEDYYNSPHLKQIFVNTVNEDLTPFLPKIAVNTLIIWGKEDKNAYTPVADAIAMHTAIAKSKLVVLSPAGHFSFLDRPKEFISSLQRFWTQL